MTTWKAEIWLREEPVPDCEDLTQTEMNDLIKKACKTINQKYSEGLQVIDFEVYEEPEKTWQVRSESIPSLEYLVHSFGHGDKKRYVCTCSLLRNGEDCKHIKKVKRWEAGE